MENLAVIKYRTTDRIPDNMFAVTFCDVWFEGLGEQTIENSNNWNKILRIRKETMIESIVANEAAIDEANNLLKELKKKFFVFRTKKERKLIKELLTKIEELNKEIEKIEEAIYDEKIIYNMAKNFLKDCGYEFCISKEMDNFIIQEIWEIK